MAKKKDEVEKPQVEESNQALTDINTLTEIQERYTNLITGEHNKDGNKKIRSLLAAAVQHIGRIKPAKG